MTKTRVYAIEYMASDQDIYDMPNVLHVRATDNKNAKKKFRKYMKRLHPKKTFRIT